MLHALEAHKRLGHIGGRNPHKHAYGRGGHCVFYIMPALYINLRAFAYGLLQRPQAEGYYSVLYENSFAQFFFIGKEQHARVNILRHAPHRLVVIIKHGEILMCLIAEKTLFSGYIAVHISMPV